MSATRPSTGPYPGAREDEGPCGDPAAEPGRSTTILLLAHAPLAAAFARVATDMGLASADLLAFDIGTEMSREAVQAAVLSMLGDRPDAECLVLVDIGGASSPYTVAQRVQAALGPRVQVVAGLNTGMLMTALCHRQSGVQDLARRAAQRGADAVERFPPAA